MTEYADVPAGLAASFRAACAGLPEAYEDTPWTGVRFRIRSATFAHAVCVEGPNGPVTYVNVHAAGDDLEVLSKVGHPFFPGWGAGIIGMVLDDATDWDEVREVVTESYCLCAPKKLSRLVERPGD